MPLNFVIQLVPIQLHQLLSKSPNNLSQRSDSQISLFQHKLKGIQANFRKTLWVIRITNIRSNKPNSLIKPNLTHLTIKVKPGLHQ